MHYACSRGHRNNLTILIGLVWGNQVYDVFRMHYFVDGLPVAILATSIQLFVFVNRHLGTISLHLVT